MVLTHTAHLKHAKTRKRKEERLGTFRTREGPLWDVGTRMDLFYKGNQFLKDRSIKY